MRPDPLRAGARNLGAVTLVVRSRLSRSWRALLVAGLLLGIGYGLCLASFAAARRTESAYGRILAGADAPDAAVSLTPPLAEAEQALLGLDGIVDQVVYRGFLGAADDNDHLQSAALLAPVGDRFPVELPTLEAGRLPDPDRADEVFVTTGAAERGDLEVGQRLNFRLVNPMTSERAEAAVTIVGIGQLPSEAVADETMVLGLVVFSRAFYEAHRDLATYGASSVDLAPGVDARRDLAPRLAAVGQELQFARSQEVEAVRDALRPLIIVLVALGVLAFAAATIAAAQVVQRNRARWRDQGNTLRSIGMTRQQMRIVDLAGSAVVAAVAVSTAILCMVAASPLAPVGPLRDLDPARGVAIDELVAVIGGAVIVATIALMTVAISSSRQPRSRPGPPRTAPLTRMFRSPASSAGIPLALRAEDGRVWRGVGAVTAAAAVLSLCVVFVASAVGLAENSSRYGFDADLLALNAYGNQSLDDLDRVFAGRDDVEAATAFTADTFLVEGRAVPGLAATSVTAEVGPTVLDGRLPRFVDEIVVGRETLDDIGAALGDVVVVELASKPGVRTTSRSGVPLFDRVALRIVGIATFPPVNQRGTDMPRLGTGALVIRDAFLEMGGDRENGPEFTMVKLTDGADPADVIGDNLLGFSDEFQTTTSWFTDTEPAELRQLSAALPYLRGSLVVGYLILVAVMIHALWTRSRANRHDLAVLRAIGTTRRQLDAVTVWQVAPFAAAAVLLGVPLGVLLGRRAYIRFAESLAVADPASVPFTMSGVLIVVVLSAAVVGGAVAVGIVRASPNSAVLRED